MSAITNQFTRMQEMKNAGHSYAEIADIMGLREIEVRAIFADHGEINWGYNCLTGSIHHGRPEKIWNLPLLQTTHMFSAVQLEELVVDRIHNDAMQYVEKGTPGVFTKEWADLVKKLATLMALPIYREKISEITKYYRDSVYQQSINDAIERNKAGKLNPRYEPLHDHDTINLLCRIVGTGANRRAAELER